jgi:hypothetical protein
MGGEILPSAKDPSLAMASRLPDVRLPGTLYAAEGNCDSMSTGATPCQEDLSEHTVAAVSYNEGDVPMPTVDIDGISPHYEISGSGLPILLMAPGGFDSAIEKWSTIWPWQHFLPLQAFCARCLMDECIPGADYWDVHLESEPPDYIRDRILDFFATHASAGVHA